ncbi:MAG: hypothetical protein JWO13_1280 [Acidobacteriales bacterium]|nr:hypothetical protein [Terriglobales bacterium]
MIVFRSMKIIPMLTIVFLLIGASAEGQSIGSPKIAVRKELIAGTIGALKTGGLIQTEEVGQVKTTSRLLVSQKLSSRRSREMYLVSVFLPNGGKVDVIAQSDKSKIPEESGLVVFVISKVLQPDGKAVPPRR